MIVDQVRAVLARVLKLSVLIIAGLALTAPVAFAQEADEDDERASEEREVEEVVVTGSRLKRDTYSSISPLQVISGQVQREIGLVDAGMILHESTATSGVQVDLTFGAFVLDNGPAATTVDLRGLGASRTLFLLNGRRLAPSGVEGAPTSPDINLIPGTLVQQYEVLLDGASSVYGSDAVAGVVNVILEQDFEGFEIEAFSNIPAGGDSAGMQNTISAKWGYNGDRAQRLLLALPINSCIDSRLTPARLILSSNCKIPARVVPPLRGFSLGLRPEFARPRRDSDSGTDSGSARTPPSRE